MRLLQRSDPDEPAGVERAPTAAVSAGPPKRSAEALVAMFPRFGMPLDGGEAVAGADSVRRRAFRFERAREAFLREINAAMPDGIVVGIYDLVPSRAWRGARGVFLAEIGRLFAAEAANSFVLPVERRGAGFLGLPPYPGTSPGLEAEALRMVDLTIKLFDRHLDREKAYAIVREQVRALPRIMMTRTFPERVWRRHEQLFGPLLGRGAPA